MSIVDKPSVDPDHTHFPDIVSDVDEGTVSIFIFLIFVLFTLAVGVSSCKCCFYLCVALSWILIFNVISIFALFSIDYQLLVLFLFFCCFIVAIGKYLLVLFLFLFCFPLNISC